MARCLKGPGAGRMSNFLEPLVICGISIYLSNSSGCTRNFGYIGVVRWTMLFRCWNEYVASLQDLLELNAMEKSESKD